MNPENVVIEAPKEKDCRYDGCNTRIPLESEFEYCEACRSIVVRNSSALRMDPFAKPQERETSTYERMISQMSGAEILNYFRKIEGEYLRLCQTVKLHNLSETKKRPFVPLDEELRQVEAMEEKVAQRRRNSIQSDSEKRKARQKKLTREEQARKLFGDKADEIMGKIKPEELEF